MSKGYSCCCFLLDLASFLTYFLVPDTPGPVAHGFPPNSVLHMAVPLGTQAQHSTMQPAHASARPFLQQAFPQGKTMQAMPSTTPKELTSYSHTTCTRCEFRGQQAPAATSCLAPAALAASRSTSSLSLDLILAVELVQGWLQDVEANPAQGGQEQQGNGAQPAIRKITTRSSSGETQSGARRVEQALELQLCWI